MAKCPRLRLRLQGAFTRLQKLCKRGSLNFNPQSQSHQNTGCTNDVISNIRPNNTLKLQQIVIYTHRSRPCKTYSNFTAATCTNFCKRVQGPCNRTLTRTRFFQNKLIKNFFLKMSLN